MGQVYNVPIGSITDGSSNIYTKLDFCRLNSQNLIASVTVNVSGVKLAAYMIEAGQVRVLMAYPNTFGYVVSRWQNNNWWGDGTGTHYAVAGEHGINGYGAYTGFDNATLLLEAYDSEEAAVAALNSAFSPQPITYRLTNCTAPDSPASAASGSTVIVPLVFSEGFGIVNPTDAYVMNNGVQVPAIWNPNDSTITFNMP